MRRIVHIVLWLLFMNNIGLSQQNTTKTWVLGDSILLDFNVDPLAHGLSALDSWNGLSAISDASGSLLFYTNGIKVWGADHLVMPNGTGLNSDLYATNSSLIVPLPESDNIYYIFTVASYAGNYSEFGGIAYSIVDMNLNGGLGDVTEKNTVLHNKSAEKQCATLHENGIDYWIMSHDYGDDQFRAFLLTSEGIVSSPVISKTGAIHREPPVQYWGYLAGGSMRFSPSGCKLALVMAGEQRDTVQVFDFDKLSGYVFNPITLKAGVNQRNPNTLCFSPDNQKLYVSGYDWILQFDLSSELQLPIQQSRTIIATNNLSEQATPKYEFEDLQIAPNGKIYVARNLTEYLSSIDLPNNAGAESAFIDTAIVFPNLHCEAGLPNFVSNYLVPDTTAAVSCTKYCPPFELGEERIICFGDSTTIELDVPKGEVMWNNGSTGFLHTISEEGAHIASYTFNDCPVLTDTINLSLIRNHLQQVSDTTLCLSPDYTLTFPDDEGINYSWSNDITGLNFTTSEAGTYILTITKYDCTFRDTLVIINNCAPEFVLPNVFTPNNDGMNDYFMPLHSKHIKALSLSIYDRWGNVVFTSEETSFSWDGTHNNKKCSAGLYFYTLHYSSLSNQVHALQGYITLLE